MTTPSPDPVIQYYNKIGRYPANNMQWWLARSEIDDASRGLKLGDFMPELLQKLYMGNLHAPRGHFILDAFNKDRSTISGVTEIPPVVVNDRPSSVSFFSGRVWYACRSTVYFSQILSDKMKAGNCFMDADPTSENISDPVDSDGGVIEIPEAYKIIRLVPHGGGMLVFARNGVWAITGTASGFTALDISVNKISPVGCRAPFSVVETEKAVFWWSDVGIMGVAQSTSNTYTPAFEKINVTETTIQAFYNAIPDAIKEEAKGVFDSKSNCILWLYRDGDVASTQYNRVLIFDMTLEAFYPWKFSRVANGPYVKGFYRSDRNNTYTIPTDIEPTEIEYITPKGNNFRISQVRSGSFVDFKTYNGTGVTYDSYLETGYELFEDAMRNKNITYLFTYLTRTETALVGGVPDYPSACNMRVKLDWASSGMSNKWTSPVSVYNPKLIFDSPDTGFGLVVTKNKIRGNGKSLQFRFETSEAGKNFDLNGWAIAVSGSPIP